MDAPETRRTEGPGIRELVAGTDAGLLVVHDTGRSARVESVVLHEPDSRQRIPPHALVLAAGYQDRDQMFDRLVAQAAEAHAVAVVAKPSSIGQDALRGLGEQHSISTVLAEQSADWLALASMFRSAAAVSSVDAVAGIRVGDLFAFANAVALATGGATAIVDPAGRLLGFSNLADQPLDDLRRRATLLMAEQDSPGADPDYRRLYASNACINIPGRGHGFDRVAVAVRSDREILGSIWVLVPPGRDPLQAEHALVPLVDSAAVHLHHARAELDGQRVRHTQLLQALLHGEAGAAAGSAAATLGLDDRAWFRLAVLVPDSARLTSMSRPQVRSVSNWLSIVHGNALFAEIESQFVVLFSGQRPEEWRYVEQSLDAFLRNADAVRGSLTVATSLAVSEARDLSSEFARLHILARTIARAGDEVRSPIRRMEDHWAQVELTTMAEAYATSDARRLSALTRIRDYDREHHSEYWETLRVWVTCDRTFTDAARRLSVHANTVRYRIERLTSMFDLDLADPATFFWVAVQVHHPSA